MKTLDEVKQIIAEEYGCEDYEELLDSAVELDYIVTDIANRFAKSVAQQALENAAENAKVEPFDSIVEYGYDVDKSSITNPDNIPLTI